VKMLDRNSLESLRREFSDISDADFEADAKAVEARCLGGGVRNPSGLLHAWLKHRRQAAAAKPATPVANAKTWETGHNGGPPASRQEYADFRTSVIFRILEEHLTPRQVAEILSDRAADFPEIQASELRNLSLMGDRWTA
jgi:hypothetical protein